MSSTETLVVAHIGLPAGGGVGFRHTSYCYAPLAELHGDRFSRRACPLEGAGCSGGGLQSNRERRKRPEETGYTPLPKGQSVQQREFQQRTKTPTTTKDRDKAYREQTAPGHLPKWILLQDWMLQH